MERNDLKLTTVFDSESRKKLEEVMQWHNDPNFTTVLKRSLATQHAIDKWLRMGKRIYAGWPYLPFIRRIIFPA